jgi:tryptophan 7-halogenase
MELEAPPRVTLVANDAVGAAIARALVSAGHPSPRLGAELPEGPLGEFTMVALEGATFGRLLDLARALLARGQPALFVTVENGLIVAGPVTVPGVTACLECRLLEGFQEYADPRAMLALYATLDTGTSADLEPDVLDAAARELARIAGRLDRVVPDRGPFTSMAVFPPLGPRPAVVLPSGLCRSCPGALDRDGVVARAALAEVGAILELEGLRAELAYSPGPVAHPDRYRTVGILGGGTAGYLTALALRTRIPDLDVTLIESSRIPIISVGEATTQEMVKFLHAPSLLACDIVDFHRAVRPTFKLGIQFLWGEAGDGRFNYPFQYATLLDSVVHEGSTDGQSVASLLMSADRAPVIADGHGAAHSLLPWVRFAYHLDNERFVRYLTEEARRRGIRHLDTVVRGAVVTADGEQIDHLVTEDGRELRFDLYVDASGFRSVLLEGALRSPFESYAGSLVTDRAIAANAPHGGLVKPYTRAHTFASGWCWTIPFEESDHLGYVYSSAFSGEDEALAEMRRVHPSLGEHRHIRFRSGRHAHFIKGNVVAVGNAYAFVEPLESTALHMLIYELEHLTNHFPLKTDHATKARLTSRMNELWDQLRWFLAIHYRFNRRLDSEFWRAARAEVDISGVEERIEIFRERAPLSDRPSLYYSVFAPEFFSGDHAFDTILLGQKFPARLGRPRYAPEAWQRRAALRRKVVEGALPQTVALPLLRDRQPELLRHFVESPSSWVHTWIAR